MDVTASASESTSIGSEYAQAMLSQDRGRPGLFSWVAQNTTPPPGEVDSFPLEHHVLAAQLLDSGADMALLLELPVRPIEGFAGIGGDLSPYSGPIPFDQLFALVQAGRAVLVLRTDIPDRAQLLRPLKSVVVTDWRRVPCD